MLDSSLNSCMSDIVASQVLAMSIAASSVRSASRPNNLSCTFVCLMPTISCSINLSLVSQASQNRHFFACSLHLVMHSSTDSPSACLYFCKWNLFSLKFVLGSIIHVKPSHRTHNFPLFTSVSSHALYTGL